MFKSSRCLFVSEIGSVEDSMICYISINFLLKMSYSGRTKCTFSKVSFMQEFIYIYSIKYLQISSDIFSFQSQGGIYIYIVSDIFKYLQISSIFRHRQISYITDLGTITSTDTVQTIQAAIYNTWYIVLKKKNQVILHHTDYLLIII